MCSIKNLFADIFENSQKSTCARDSGTLAQVFSCEFYEISKNTFFIEHLQENASTFQRDG